MGVRRSAWAGAGRRSRLLGRAVAGVVTLALLSVVLASSASAAGAADIMLKPASGPPTTTFGVTGVGFGPSETVSVRFDTTVLGSPVTDGNGNFSFSTAVPASAQPGKHAVTATGTTSGLSASRSFKVQSSWAQYQFDPAHTGFNPFENTLTTANASTLVSAWTFTGNQPGRVSPTVAKGVVYFSDIDPSLGSTVDVYAVSASSGNVKWERVITFGDPGSCPAPVYAGIGGSSAAVAGTTVYVGFGDRYCMMAFNASTGATKWVAAETPAAGGRGFHSAVTVSGNTVYALGDNHVLYARATSDGSLRWSRAINNQGISEEDSVPAVATVTVGGHPKKLVFVGSRDFNLYAFNATTGAPVWSFATGREITVSPAVAGQLVYLSTDSNLYALHAGTGLIAWSAATPGGQTAGPALADGLVYTGAGTVYAFDALTGTPVWSTFLDLNGATSSMAVANGVLYTGRSGSLQALDAANGNKLFTGAAGTNIFCGGPVVADGRIYYGICFGAIHAYKLP